MGASSLKGGGGVTQGVDEKAGGAEDRLPPEPSAYTHGFAAGLVVGERAAIVDGVRLGRLHGTAFGGELGSLEGLALVLRALSPALQGGAGSGGSAAQGSRLSRGAQQVQELVAGLQLTSGAPLPQHTDCMDILLRCRAKAKVCCAACNLPPTCASLAGWSVASSSSSSSSNSSSDSGSAGAAAGRVAIDF